MISKFTDIGIPEDVAKAMDDMGWEEPTPIQINSIPLGLKGVDMFGQAQTGTGKTGAYGSIILGTIEACPSTAAPASRVRSRSCSRAATSSQEPPGASGT